MVAVPTLGGGIVAPSRRKPCRCVSDRPSLVAASSAHTSSGLLDYVSPTRAAITCRDRPVSNAGQPVRSERQSVAVTAPPDPYPNPRSPPRPCPDPSQSPIDRCFTPGLIMSVSDVAIELND